MYDCIMLVCFVNEFSILENEQITYYDKILLICRETAKEARVLTFCNFKFITVPKYPPYGCSYPTIIELHDPTAEIN